MNMMNNGYGVQPYGMGGQNYGYGMNYMDHNSK